MNFSALKATRLNWPLLALVLVLAIFGIFAIYSATWMRDQDFWSRQLVWLLVGVALCAVVSLRDYEWVRTGAVPLYLAAVVALVITHLTEAFRRKAREAEQRAQEATFLQAVASALDGVALDALGVQPVTLEAAYLDLLEAEPRRADADSPPPAPQAGTASITA